MCPTSFWSMEVSIHPCEKAGIILYLRVHFLPPMMLTYRRLNSDLLLQCNLTIHTCGSSVNVLLFITDTYTEFLFY